MRRLPIDLRRAASPHAALRQTQRFPPSHQASTSAERVADGDAETMRKQGANFAELSSRGWSVPDLAVSCPRKGFQNHWFWRRSFLPFFCRRKKGSRRRHKNCSAGGNGSPRARSALAMTGFFMSCGAIPGGKVWSPRPMGARSTVGRDDVGIVPYETMTRNVAHNTADAECIPAASGQRGPA